MNEIAIHPLDADELPAALRFIGSWSTNDIYDRFGTLGCAGPHWLASELRENAARRALLARDGDLCGLLDYVATAEGVHVGVLVAAERRRRRIGRALMMHLVAHSHRAQRLIADCRPDNRAAIGLLRSCGFTRVSYGAHEMRWVRA